MTSSGEVRRILVGLDSNIWRYLVDAGALDVVRRTARSTGAEIAILPAVLYETLRMTDGAVKRALIEAQTRQVWRRVMPEAYSEAEELRRAIEALRPEWISRNTDLESWRQLRSDWSSDWRSGTWARSRRQTQSMSARIGDGDIPTAREEANAARELATHLGLSFGRLSVDKFESWFEQPMPGWNGQKFASWRAEAMNTWLPVFFGPWTGAYSDWLRPFLRRGIVQGDFASWVRFWTRDVPAELVPRQWMRSTMRTVASTRKTSPGSPVDLQISTYLVELDVFCTSDSVFVDCIEKVRTSAPGRIAETRLLRAGASSVDDLLQCLVTRAVAT